LPVGIVLKMAPGWHTYWDNPGDAGMSTRVQWSLPPGFGAGPIEWPLPKQLVEPGDILVYSYKGEVMLMTTLVVPKEIEGSEVEISAEADWLVCEAICVPGSASLTLTLPVADSSSPANEELFARFRSQLPSVEAPPYPLIWTRSADGWKLEVSGLEAGQEVELYPLPALNQSVGHARIMPESGGRAEIELSADGELRGVLIVNGPGDRREGWLVASSGDGGETSAASALAPAAGPGLWLALFYGFLGGLILNVMPCVLPVISLKIFGFMQQAGDEPGKVFRHGLAFAAGILTWFLVLGLVIVFLQAGGSQVTWAFQFQNPWFIFFICTVVFVFALNLFGVFEIVLPGSATTKMSEVASHGGYTGSFFQGGFATLLATPCTAPFLGAALGFAFSQPPVVILAMFTSVALGMASPYLVLSARPGWMKFLPKPGMWMERVKQFMGFPLLATALWLLYVLGNQKGLDAVMAVSAFLLVLALAAWIYGQLACGARTVGARWAALLIAVILTVGGAWAFGGQFARSEAAASQGGSGAVNGIDWVEFSPAELQRLIAEGRPVFLDFTADWCLTCKFNERSAINTAAVRKLIEEKGIVPMKADWTNSNPDITAALAQFGRVGVPFYLFYPGGGETQPVILPELLTESIVLEALGKAVEG